MALPRRPPRLLAPAVPLLAALLLVSPHAWTLFFQRPIVRSLAAQGRPAPRFALFGFGNDVDESFYAARAQEASVRWPAGNPYVAEDRTARLRMMDAASFAVLGLLQRAVGNMEAVWLIARAACLALWVWLLFLLLAEASGEPESSLCAAALWVLLADWADLPRIAGTLVESEGYLGAAANVLMLRGPNNLSLGPQRLPAPCLSGLLFLMAGWMTTRLLASRPSRALPWACATGLLSGALAYVHADVWSIQMAALALLPLWCRLRRRDLVQASLCGLAAALAVSLPWMSALARADADFLKRNLVVSTRAPSWESFAYLALGAFAFREAAREKVSTPLLAWLGLALTGVFLTLNQQVLTGLGYEPYHWARFGRYLAVVLLTAALLPRARGNVRRWAGAAAAAGLLVAARGVGYGWAHRYSHLQSGEMRQALDWLARSVPANPTVLALSPLTNLVLPIYGRARTAVSCDSWQTSDLSTDQNAVRVARAAAALRIPLDGFLDYALPDSFPTPGGGDAGPMIAADRTFFSYVFFTGFPADELDDALRRAWSGKEGAVPARADYLWIGPYERGLIAAAGGRVPPGARRAFENSAITIYRLR